ncbi:6,7-dimethyl-8-ribityllumazine synthase [Phenylobacterium soli]|uniref:6,7-dimethyl-8-ribityllumazine synthase n=1 Tax=Phenylobacterium soli TaxID=2170551 RepID=A0A328AMY9_9CAUL|nr:6,7-dimethyl-8-ribityllumazine synthase [Phenylobacterium soli]RAK55705.1 6,7-dimethyl-8-ribityllumazine synthase [Phenylobacterium soli]
MTQAIQQASQPVAYELPTANGAYRAARIGFVHGLWHADIVREAHTGFVEEMTALGFPAEGIDRFETPGAFEIPLHAQTLARTGRYAAIVAAAFVVDGGIYRHDFVAGTVVNALMQVQLATETPVFSVVLTPHHFHEHDVHQRFFYEHFRVKGQEAARACRLTLDSLAKLAA